MKILILSRSNSGFIKDDYRLLRRISIRGRVIVDLQEFINNRWDTVAGAYLEDFTIHLRMSHHQGYNILAPRLSVVMTK